MNLSFSNLLISINNLNNSGNLDVDALKTISKEMVVLLNGHANESEFLTRQITFIFDLLVFALCCNNRSCFAVCDFPSNALPSVLTPAITGDKVHV